MLLLLLTLLPLHLHGTSLPAPLDVGVVVKVGEELIRGIAEEIAEKAEEELKATTLSDTIRDGKTTYTYWNLRFGDLSLEPHIDLSKSSRTGELTVDGSLSGNVRVTGQWRVQYKTWAGTISATGGVTVQLTDFSVTGRVRLGGTNGTNSQGEVRFRHDPRYCSMNVGDFGAKFSGRTGWLLNLVVTVFKSALEDKIEEQICEKINENAKEVARDLEDSVLARHDSVNVLGHTVVFNNRPWVITGGETCAVFGALGEIETDIAEGEPTTAFIKPTTEPAAPLEPDEPATEDAGMGTAFSTSSSFTSSVTEERIRKRRSGEERIRKRRSGEDVCSALPGGTSAVSVIVTEEMVTRIANNLHKLRLIDYKAVQVPGTRNDFMQYWGSAPIGEVTFPTTHEILRDYHTKFRITSTSPPNITIDTEGVFIVTNLRTRMTLTGDVFTGKLEIHTSGEFLAKLLLEYRDGIYRLVPSVELRVDIDDVKVQLGNSLGDRIAAPGLRDTVADAIKEQLDEMLTNKLPGLIRDELAEGCPINIPSCVLIERAEIVYREDYIVITAQDVVVTL